VKNRIKRKGWDQEENLTLQGPQDLEESKRKTLQIKKRVLL
jgi:hypothetical protein